MENKETRSCGMEDPGSPWRKGSEPRAWSVDSDEGETSHFAVYRR